MSHPPIEIDATGLPPLGMPAERFLRDYWQKRPLLIRNAFPDFQSPLMPEDLAGLACEDGVLARLITHERKSDRWQLRNGPFPESLFPTLPDHDWTLLVQDVEKWDADVAALLPHFSFLPRWRIDDVMISFAAPGGSVGAHIDQYDVFLLQSYGHRRWMIDDRPNPPLHYRPDTELRLLQRFDPNHEWVLAPGDMLYLPPGVPHHGVAEDPCLTISVGMRAPSSAELLADWVDDTLAEASDELRYSDPDIAPPTDPNEIDAAAMQRVVDALERLRMDDPGRMADWFGRFITVYRVANEAAPADVRRSRIEVEWDLQQGGSLHRHPWTRMAWRRSDEGAKLYVAGRDIPLPLEDARSIAAAAVIDGALYASLSEAGRNAVIDLLGLGHYQLLLADDIDPETEQDEQ